MAKTALLVSMVLLGLISAIVAEDAAPAEVSDLISLTAADFDTKTSNGEPWLLEFFAPWCGHCKKLAPTYKELATKLKGTANVANVDCTVEKDICKRFGIRGYPTIKFMKEGKLYDFSGARTIESFEEFVTTKYTSATANDVPPAPAAEAKTDL